jgi:hypothetical protein
MANASLETKQHNGQNDLSVPCRTCATSAPMVMYMSLACSRFLCAFGGREAAVQHSKMSANTIPAHVLGGKGGNKKLKRGQEWGGG